MSYNPCARGCCWTPQGVCAKKRAGMYHCDCHLSPRAREQAERLERRDIDTVKGDTYRVTGNTRRRQGMGYVRNDPTRRREYRLLAAAEDANQIILAARAEAKKIIRRANEEADRQARLAKELGMTRARANRDARIARAERPHRVTINYTRLDELAAGRP